MAIRQAVQRGDVAAATELVNELDPDVRWAVFLSFFLLSSSKISTITIFDGSVTAAEVRSRMTTVIKSYYAPLSELLLIVMIRKRLGDDDRTQPKSHI